MQIADGGGASDGESAAGAISMGGWARPSLSWPVYKLLLHVIRQAAAGDTSGEIRLRRCRRRPNWLTGSHHLTKAQQEGQVAHF